MKQLGTAALLYAADYESLPRFGSWIEDLNPYDKTAEILTCPVLKGQGKQFGYGMNGQLPRRGEEFEGWSETPLFLETSDLKPNALVYAAASPSRHDGSSALVFCDGHGRSLMNENFDKLRLNPPQTKAKLPKNVPQ